MIATRILSHYSQPSRTNVDYQKIVPVFELGDCIPRQIVQTCKSEVLLPKELSDNIEHIKNLNNGWKYTLYEDKDIEHFILVNYGQTIHGYYKRISPKYGAAKADLFRYLYLYKEGGIYLDIKSSICKPFDEVLNSDDKFILSRWDNRAGEEHQGVGFYSDLYKNIPDGEIPQWFIIAAKGHPILRDVIIRVLQNIDNYNPYVNGVGWSGTVYTTGPVPYTLAVHENICNYQYRNIGAYTNIGLIYSIYETAHGNGSTYHAKAIKSDYRKNTIPVIAARCRLLELANRLYLKIVSR